MALSRPQIPHYKSLRGGKGVGRFLWLVAFKSVEVDSHFEQDGKMWRRQFEFIPVGDGIRNMATLESDQRCATTTIRLLGFREKYQQPCPKRADTLATHLIEHCLEYLSGRIARKSSSRIVATAIHSASTSGLSRRWPFNQRETQL